MTSQNQPLKTILIIEDDLDVQAGIKLFLEFEDYKVLTANNGFDAMELLKSCDMPNLILLDMKMPVMDGWQFAAAFLAKYKNGSPIIVMTAAPDAEVRAQDINATDWIPKPFNLDIMLEKIKKYER